MTQSFSLNTTDNVDTNEFCDDLIKSLSEDDDEENEKELYSDNAYESPLPSKLSSPSPSHTPIINAVHESDDSQPDDVNLDLIETEKQKEEDLEDVMIDYDKNLVLDKDIEIAKMLNKNGYKNVTKLCCTDQGSVWRAKSLKNKSVVIKIASKLYYKENRGIKGEEKQSLCCEHENILNEIALLKLINKEQLNCDCQVIKNGIIQLMDTIDHEEYIVVILEDGGIDLFGFIKSCHQQIANGKITIKEWIKTVQLISKKLAKLLHFLHGQMNICHLDWSLENVLISDITWISYPDQYKNYKKKLSPDFQLKLIDFGAAKQFDDNSFITDSIIGKPLYISPQIYRLQSKQSDQPFDARKSDIWSFGVSLFIMMIGSYPWTVIGCQLYQTIVLENNLDFILTAWNRSNYINESMKDLLQKIFVVNEKDRISTKDIIKHSWLC